MNINDDNYVFIGGDISLNHGAITLIDSNADHIKSYWYGDVVYLNTMPTTPVSECFLLDKCFNQNQKIKAIYDICNKIKREFSSHIVYAAIEGYAFNSRTSSLTSLAEAAAMFKIVFNDAKDMTFPSPTSVKKYATGNSRAEKEDMMHASKMNCSFDVCKIFNFDPDRNLSAAEDVCDSYYIARYMRDYVYATHFGAGVTEALNTSSAYAFSKLSNLGLDKKKETTFRKNFLCVK